MMVSITQKEFYNCFYLLCLLFAFLMTLRASLEYVKNEDIIEISYRKFNPNEEDDQYPAISLCFAKPYNESKFSNKVGYTNSSSYDDFVTGKHWNETMMEIDYNHVTINIRDHLLDTCMITTRSRECHEINKIETIIFPSPIGVLKCFSFHQILGLDYEFNDKEKINLDEVMIGINNSIFPNNVRPSSGQFLVMFHYPFQLIRSIYTTFYNWPSRDNATYYSMQFNIQAVEKLKRRTGWNRHCYEWRYFDSRTMEDVMSAVGCKPPYWISRHNQPDCNNSDQMGKIILHNMAKLYQNDQFQKDVPPCVEFKKIDVKFEELTGDENNIEYTKHFYDRCADIAGGKENWFVIHLHFWSSIDFKEIKQIRAYSMMSVIGNASGYIGFALGWSISELPRLIFWLYAKRKKLIINWLTLMTQK